MKVCLVRFLSPNSKSYAYFIPPWVEPIEVNDRVIVETRDTISVGIVTSTNPTSYAASKATAHIIQRIDLQEHADKLKQYYEEH